MKCPNCSLESPDTEAECRRCGLIFAKWRAGPSTGAVSAPAPGAAGAEVGLSLDTLLLFALFLSLAGYYFVRSRTSVAASTGEPLDTLEADAAGGKVTNPCYLEGEVLDVYRLMPVAGARIHFRPRFAAVTNGEGKYQVRVAGRVAYAADFTHGDYQPHYVAGFSRDWRHAPWDQRVRAARSVLQEADQGAPKPAAFGCESGDRKILNFALIPQRLSDEEKERISAVP